MAFEMSLPHAPRIQAVGADGAETLAQDEQQWDLFFTVQQALQAQGGGPEQDEGAEGAEGQEGGAAAAQAPQPTDPQKVLEKLISARSELDVIVDLVTFVEQQQFLSVAGVHRQPPSLADRVRARALRLAAAKQQLRRAADRLAGGTAALRAQEAVEGRFLGQLAELRRRWRLARHAGEAAMFYADISLPLRGAAGAGISQEGAQCNIVMDTNGDACIVEAAGAGGGRRRAVRGAQHIHSVLEARQQLMTWQVLRQVAAAQARQARHEADPDGAVAAVLQMVGAAVAACQAAVHAAVAAGASPVPDSAGASAMDVDGSGRDGSSQREQQQQPQAAALAGAAAAGAMPSLGSSNPLLSTAAKDMQAAVASPGFQQQFESCALLLLSRLLPGGAAGAAGAAPRAEPDPQAALLDSLLCWLRHAALCHRVTGTLCVWASSAPGRAVRRVDSGEEFTTVWQLLGSCQAAGSAPVLVVAVGDALRLEGLAPAAGSGSDAAGATAAQRQRGLARAELDRALQALLSAT